LFVHLPSAKEAVTKASALRGIAWLARNPSGIAGSKALDKVMRIAAASIGVGLLVLALKTAAWWVTGSAAFYSDALETVVNVVASCIALGAVIFAAKPADNNHPYGHAKAEFVAAVVEGVLIVVASLSILQHAWLTWHHPHLLHAPVLGIGLSFIATGVNGAWAMVLFGAARRSRSPALRGDARHLLGDVVTSLGVMSGVLLVVFTGILRLDPLLAAATAAYVLWSGVHLIGESVGGLMDMAPADDTVARIEAVLRANGDGAIEAHDIRARQAGRSTFVQFHLVVPGSMSVDAAHDICDRIENALKHEMQHLIVNIHVEPESKIKTEGALALASVP
jgi:cation diffusion facilitator family transporter